MGLADDSPTIAFDNSFVRDLEGLYERWTATTAPAPRLLVLNDALAQDLGLDANWLRSPDGVEVLVGNVVPAGAEPVAQAYAGHQFGGFSPRLGDGRALLLGEIISPSGERHDLHLKGSGRTPFARGGDGKAVVGPMLREYVIAEAMHALGIRTTRSLAVVATGDLVTRERPLPGAVLARTASSHLRVGSFQYAAGHPDETLLVRLVDHAIARHAPAADADNPALALLDHVIRVQAELIASWMSVGFIHGVMNTDNTTISGETIDYGPCAFMDAYDPSTVYSSIDHGGRYAFGNQPGIAQWNITRLAETLLPLIDSDGDRAVEVATEMLRTFPDRYLGHWRAMQRRKLGLSDERTGDDELIDDALDLLRTQRVDHTGFFRALSGHVRGDRDGVRRLFADPAPLDAWADRWIARLDATTRGPDRIAADLDAVNPVYIPRNHLVEAALEAATGGDLTAFDELMVVLARPFTERPGLERFAQPAPADFGRYQTFCGT